MAAPTVLVLSMLAASGSAAAAIPGRDGRIHACYKAKGKAKGTMRIVAGKHCRRGERRLAWSLTGPSGAAGSGGSQGSSGSAGSQGEPGAGGASSPAGGTTLAGLESKVNALTLEVDRLEKLLDGVSSGELSGVVGKLSGITSAQLDEAVSAVPTVSALAPKVADVEGLLQGVASGDLEGLVSDLPALCGQAKTLTDQSNLLAESFGEIKVLSGLVTLGLPEPPELSDFSAC